MPAPSKLTVHRGADATAALGTPSWDALVERQERPNPTLLGGWQCALHDGRHGEALVVTFDEGSDLVAGGAFAARTALGGRIRIATWLGGAFQPFSPDMLADDAPAATAVAEALLDEVDVVKLIATEDSVAVRAIRASAPWASVRPAQSGTFTLSLPLQRSGGLGKHLAYDERRAIRRGATVEIRIAEEPIDVARGLERLFRMHRARWSERADSNGLISASSHAREFHRTAIGALARERKVRLVEVTENGVVVGSVIGLVAGRGAVAYVMSMRRADQLTSPGARALVELVGQLEREECTFVDLGGGALSETSPKARLQPMREPFVEVLAASSQWLQRLVNLAPRGLR